MGPFKKRKIMKNLAEGKFNDEDAEALRNDHVDYGELEEFSKEEIDGRKLQTTYNEQIVDYWIPQDGAWISGKGITLTKVYRIFEEDDKVMKLGEVYDPLELEGITIGLHREIRNITKKK